MGLIKILSLSLNLECNCQLLFQMTDGGGCDEDCVKFSFLKNIVSSFSDTSFGGKYANYRSHTLSTL